MHGTLLNLLIIKIINKVNQTVFINKLLKKYVFVTIHSLFVIYGVTNLYVLLSEKMWTL